MAEDYGKQVVVDDYGKQVVNDHGNQDIDDYGKQVVDSYNKPSDLTDNTVELPSENAHAEADDALATGIHEIEAKGVHWYSYLATKDFWLLIAIGQTCCLCNTGTSVFSTLLVMHGTSVPAFQTLFNYILLSLIYVPFMLYRYGFKKFTSIFVKDGWKYFILSFMDVEGNFTTVLAYRWTNLLSAQLINFWSIVCVVTVSFLILRVRYKWAQIAGILVACGGMGLLLGSDHITGSNGGSPPTMLKGDLFCLLGATFYGLSNVFEEWYLSKRPIYEVLSFMGLWGMCINAVTAAIFDRATWQTSTWNGPSIGYVIGYTLCLTIFYSLAPFMFRMGSAAFFDISLLTGNFWGTIIGIHVFGYTIYYLYPIAFVLIILGLLLYFLAGSMLGDSKKPWLGDNQEEGIAGLGTAKLKALNEARRRGLANSEGERV